MSTMRDIYSMPTELVLGTRFNERVPRHDQERQRKEVLEILRRLRRQPGLILADEVGMGKTFVALAVAYGIAIQSPRGPVIIMVPAHLIDKWVQDLSTFCELYLLGHHPVERSSVDQKASLNSIPVIYGIARHSIELMKLLDDSPSERCHLIFLAQGAMSRRQSDKWIRLALIAEALRRHGKGRAARLIQVKNNIHKYLAELVWAIGEERAFEGGEKLWQLLLKTAPEAWKDLYNSSVKDERRLLLDDPVPKSVTRALNRIELKALSEALLDMPVRSTGGSDRVSDRINKVRIALRQVEHELWKDLLAQTRWRSPLLVMDEAHHLKNPGTTLARQLQSPDSDQDLRTGDGAMAKAFDRMLFLTATPFQLGHHELVNVLKRFGDVRWVDAELGSRDEFISQLGELNTSLNDSQRTAIALQRCWCKLQPEDCGSDIDAWWEKLLSMPQESLSNSQRAVINAYADAKYCRAAAEKCLKPWVIRHDKGTYWAGTKSVLRRQRLDGRAVSDETASGGLLIPPQLLLPFFLAARSAIRRDQDLLGEALCSSYEAFRLTRKDRVLAKDEQDEPSENLIELSQSSWYLEEFDRTLEGCSGAAHPKVSATIKKVVDLWEAGEKVLVFAFYRHTCRALRIHISQEIERRVMSTGLRRLLDAGWTGESKDVEKLIERAQRRYFDDADSPGRRSLDTELREIVIAHKESLDQTQVSDEQREAIIDVMRRFLRVSTTLVRCFPLHELDGSKPAEVIAKTLNHIDASGISWRQKFHGFITFIATNCSVDERKLFIDAALGTRTGGIRVEIEEDEALIAGASEITLANVQVATGKTKRDTRTRLMRAFNTPFFPDILVCSEVMGEGVDLQRFCRHVIHHDLAWNPSTIEQRTGRIDRLGCKAEGRQSIVVYLPYLAGTADERQYRVMSDRERWFRVVMGQDQVAELIGPDGDDAVPLPSAVTDELTFNLDLFHSK